MLDLPYATKPLAGVGAPFELFVQSARRSLVFLWEEKQRWFWMGVEFGVRERERDRE